MDRKDQAKLAAVLRAAQCHKVTKGFFSEEVETEAGRIPRDPSSILLFGRSRN